MMTLNELLETFPTEESCKAFLQRKRWPNGKVRCPKCGNEKVFHVTHRPFHWVCKAKDCGGRNGYRFSVISGTIFQDTKWPLRDWFVVAHLMLNAKKGISSLNVKRIIGCKKEKTAWYMCHRIRAAMKDDQLPQLLGIVEVDEMYHGGKAHNMHAKKRRELALTGTKGKVAVIGAIARKGNVVCRMIENTDTPTLDSFVRRVVNRERVDLVATDEHSGYRLLGEGGKQFALPHEVVRHSSGEYVRGIVHTNSIESFWSLFKRGVVGTFHKVSKKYMPLYLAEFQFRFNNRKNPNMFDDLIAGC